MSRRFTTLLGAAALVAAPVHAQQLDDEATYYTVEHLPVPDGELLEVGGLAFLPDGRLVASTRRGQVWIVEDPLADDAADARFSLFAEGLWEGLGLAVVDGEICVLQRGELSRLRDTDGDGLCDRVDTLADDWGLSGNYHEFAFGLPVDDAGRFYASLNVSFFSPKWWHGKSPVPYRGWVVRIEPDGSVVPFASGFRSPAGLGWSASGQLLVTDNQGDWMPASPIFHVVEGGFYGHPASLDWTEAYRASQTLASDTVPPARAAEDRRPAAIWLPYKWSRSPGNLVPDDTGGRFGPFGGQLFVAELTNGMILRADLEEVGGVVQGWVAPFRQQVGSSVRVEFAPDGSLFAGLTNRGWGGLAPASGLARIRWTGVTPLELRDVRLLSDGFAVRFTKPLAAEWSADPANVQVTQYDYDYWWEYGSPERDTTPLDVTAVALDDARSTLTFRVAGLQPARVARVVLHDVVAADGSPLLHDELAYTINQLPDGPATTAHVARVVPPPPARESAEEGWLRLTWGDATDRWDAEGWELCDAELDPDDPTRFVTREGVNALANTASDAPTDYVSKLTLADAEVHVEFMLPEDGRAAVSLMGRYDVLLDGREPGRTPGLEDCGALAPGTDFPGAAPALSAYRGAGQWHDLDIEFQAPRFDAAGNRIEHARFLRVMIDDVLLHENVAVSAPSAGALPDERASGPLVLRGRGTDVAFGNVRVKRLVAAEPAAEGVDGADATAGWTELLPEDGDLLAAGWRISEEGLWTLEDDVLVGEGPRSHLFSPRADYRDLELRARVKISDGGNSGIYVRAAHGEGWPAGYEAQINSSFPDPQKTGSLYDLAPVLTHLVAPDTWFDYGVRCTDEPDGTRIVVSVNGIVVTDFLDTERRHAAGHVAIQQHHDGSVVEVESLRVREL